MFLGNVFRPQLVPSSALFDELMRRPENLKLKYFLEKSCLCDVWKLFSYVFLWRWGIELCGSLSCLGALRCLLNTEGILTLPMFLLGDGSLIWMWSASFAWWCRVLLSLSIIVKSLSSAFGCFVEMWGGFW